MNKNFHDKVGEELDKLELKGLTCKDKEDFLNEMYNIMLLHLKSDNLS